MSLSWEVCAYNCLPHLWKFLLCNVLGIFQVWGLGNYLDFCFPVFVLFPVMHTTQESVVPIVSLCSLKRMGNSKSGGKARRKNRKGEQEKDSGFYFCSGLCADCSMTFRLLSWWDSRWPCHVGHLFSQEKHPQRPKICKRPAHRMKWEQTSSSTV